MNIVPNKEWLLSFAVDREDGTAVAFASVIDSAARQAIQPPNLNMGLSLAAYNTLLDRYFPGASLALELAREKLDAQSDEVCCTAIRTEEFADLVDLLLEHRVDDKEQTEWVAYAIASGCMGGDHLYHDMGLPNREPVSRLLSTYFPALFAKNEGARMKWKKFLYKQLCDRAEVKACAAPTCQQCDHYTACFGPEDETGLAVLSQISGRAPVATDA